VAVLSSVKGGAPDRVDGFELAYVTRDGEQARVALAEAWRQAHVAGPTDLRPAALPVPNFVGEYQGLGALRGRGFAAVFTLAAPQARNGPTDIFFARIGPG
jgi:hypothetical protein